MSTRTLIHTKTQEGDEGGTAESLTTYAGLKAVGERIVARHGLWKEAAALAFISGGPYDVRPHLLLLYFGQDAQSIEPCVEYGTNYLRAWCKRYGIGRHWGGAFRDAAADGLAVLYWGRHTRGSGRVTVSERVTQLRIAPRDYLMLRTKIEDIYRARLVEAVQRFEAVMSAKLERFAPAESHTETRDSGLPACISECLASRAA